MCLEYDMPPLRQLSAKQEAFCVFYFTTRHGTQSAIKAGYSPDTAREMASENLTKPTIQARLAELQASIPPSEEQAIAFVIERKKLLTKIARHKIEVPVSAGHKVAAIKEINLMERVYEEPSGGQDNRVLNIFVIDRETKELLTQVKERTGKLIDAEYKKG